MKLFYIYSKYPLSRYINRECGGINAHIKMIDKHFEINKSLSLYNLYELQMEVDDYRDKIKKTTNNDGIINTLYFILWLRQLVRPKYCILDYNKESFLDEHVNIPESDALFPYDFVTCGHDNYGMFIGIPPDDLINRSSFISSLE